MDKGTVSVLNIRIAGKPLVCSGMIPFTPLGALSVATVLEEAGFQVNFYDYLPYARSVSSYEEDLLQFLSDKGSILAISTIFVDLPFLFPAIERLANDPERIVILGGPGVTAIGSELMKVFPYIDAVVEGEGEITVTEVIEHLLGIEKKQSISGAVIRNGNQVIVGSKRTRFNNLSGFPNPSYHLIPSFIYKKGSVASSRGCGYSCSFCSIPVVWGNKVVFKNIELLIDEMELLVSRYGITHFSIVDDVFTISDSRVKQFCQGIANRGLAITWDCFGRIELFNEYLIALMVENGLTNIYYGAESGADRVLKKINKQFTTDQALKVISATRSLCPVTASFIWGLPFESLEDFKKTLSFMEYLSKNDVEIQQSAICPLQGTPIFNTYHQDLVFSLDMLPNAIGLSVSEVRAKAELITRHPEIFSGFYQVKHHSLLKKWEIANKFGLVPSIKNNGISYKKMIK